MPPLALRHVAPRILERALLPLAAKKVGLDPPSRHLTLSRHVNHRFTFDRQLVRYSLASASAPAYCPRILERVLLPSAAKKVGLDPPSRHLTLSCHINHRFTFHRQLVRYLLASAGALACCPRNLEQALLSSAAKIFGLDPPSQHLNLSRHVNHRFIFDR